LPPSSPGIDRIEEASTKIKQHLRATRAGIQEDLNQTFAEAFSLLIAGNERGWFWHSMSKLQKQ